MVQRVATAPGAEGLTVVARAGVAVAAAADHLGVELAELPQSALRCQLEDLRHRLEQRLASGAASAHESASTAQLLAVRLR